MNIIGLLFKNPFLQISDIEYLLRIELTEKRTLRWEECESAPISEGEIMIYLKNRRGLIYHDLTLLEAREKEIRNLAWHMNQACIFGCGETAMSFYFEWYEYKNILGVDAYDLSESFEMEGDNRLELNEDDDIIFDGLFPLISDYTRGIKEDEVCTIYSYKFVEKGTNRERFKKSDFVRYIALKEKSKSEKTTGPNAEGKTQEPLQSTPKDGNTEETDHSENSNTEIERKKALKTVMGLVQDLKLGKTDPKGEILSFLLKQMAEHRSVSWHYYESDASCSKLTDHELKIALTHVVKKLRKTPLKEKEVDVNLMPLLGEVAQRNELLLRYLKEGLPGQQPNFFRRIFGIW